MENNRGVLSRPSVRQATIQMDPVTLPPVVEKEKKSAYFATGLLTLILIVTYMFTLKMYEPVRNMLITGSIMVYPLSFLIIAYVSKYYGFKEAKKSVFMSSILFAIFILLVMICLMPTANNATAAYNMVIQYIFANNYVEIGTWTLFYPILGQFFGLIIAYVTGHLIYAKVYDAIHGITVDYLAAGLGIFIGYIVDRMLFIPLLYAESLIKKMNSFQHLIKCLTSEFMGAILGTLIVIVVYVVISTIKDKKNKKKASV